jgi:hypothetical protein
VPGRKAIDQDAPREAHPRWCIIAEGYEYSDMNALVPNISRVKPTQWVGLACILLGALAAMVTFSMLKVAVTPWDTGEEVPTSLRILGQTLFALVAVGMTGLPAAIALYFGLQLIREPTLTVARWASAALAFMVMVTVSAIPFALFVSGSPSATFNTMQSLFIVVLIPAGLWMYAHLCARQAHSLGQTFYRPADFITRRIMLVAAFLVWIAMPRLFEHARLGPDGMAFPMFLLAVVSAVLPIAAAFGSYFCGIRWLARRHRALTYSREQSPG